MKKFTFIICLLAYVNSYAQKLSSKQKVIDKWVHATINIQCQGSLSEEEEMQETERSSKIFRQFLNHEISEVEYRRKTDSITLLSILRNNTGTATYLLYNKHHYLLTARHVLAGGIDPEHPMISRLFLVNDVNNPGNIRQIDTNNNMYYSGEPEPFLMNYNIFMCSSINDDIAIICLDDGRMGTRFWKALDKRGYVPVGIDDIDFKCDIKSNQKFLSIGYPQDISLVGKKILPIAAFMWESFSISQPILTNGQIADAKIGNNYFYGDIFVYHGNSGGPAIVNNKLVGIVHGSAVDTLRSNTFHYGLYHTVFMKSTLIEPLLKKFDSLFPKK